MTNPKFLAAQAAKAEKKAANAGGAASAVPAEEQKIGEQKPTEAPVATETPVEAKPAKQKQ
jgi:cell division septation protein DedD